MDRHIMAHKIIDGILHRTNPDPNFEDLSSAFAIEAEKGCLERLKEFTTTPDLFEEWDDIYFEAAKTGQENLLGHFLNFGINIERKNSYGRTAVLCAIEGDQVKTVEYLHSMGADLKHNFHTLNGACNLISSKEMAILFIKKAGVTFEEMFKEAMKSVWTGATTILLPEIDINKEIYFGPSYESGITDTSGCSEDYTHTALVEATRRGDCELMEAILEHEDIQLHRLENGPRAVENAIQLLDDGTKPLMTLFEYIPLKGLVLDEEGTTPLQFAERYSKKNDLKLAIEVLRDQLAKEERLSEAKTPGT